MKLGLAPATKSIRILALEDHPYRLRDDVQIQAQRPIAQVVEVVINARLHLRERLGLPAVAVHLGPAGDSRLDLVPLHVAPDQLAVHLVVRHGVRPGSDDAHAALQDIDELRQLVERGPAYAGSQPPHARAAPAALPAGYAVLGDGHGAELVEDDCVAVEAVAAVPENRRPG